MSVLIEALCLVVKRSVLDATVPGGTDGFLAHCAEQEGVRYAIADDHVTAICAFEPDVLSAIIGYLLDHDLTEYGEDEMPSGYQVIDMETGPTRDFPWLTVVSHRHGLTEAWMSEVALGPLVVPDGWTPEDSWSLTRTDVRDDGPDSVVRLSQVDGIDSWLDFRTGEILLGTNARSPVKHVVPTADDPRLREEALADNERLAAVLRLMRRTGIAYAFDTERRMVSVMLAVGEFPRGVPQSVAPDRAMRVSAGPQKDVSAYQFETVLPIRLGSPGIPASGTTMRDRLVPMIADNAKDIIIDDRTGTISIVSVWPIDGNETLERVVEQGVAQASTLGQRALIALALS